MQAKAAQSNDIALESVKKANKTVIRYINHSRLSINNAYDYPFISPYVYQSAVCYLETGKMIDNLEKEQHLMKALTLSKNSLLIELLPDIQFGLGDYYFEQKRYDLAQQQFTDGLYTLFAYTLQNRFKGSSKKNDNYTDISMDQSSNNNSLQIAKITYFYGEFTWISIGRAITKLCSSKLQQNNTDFVDQLLKRAESIVSHESRAVGIEETILNNITEPITGKISYETKIVTLKSNNKDLNTLKKQRNQSGQINDGEKNVDIPQKIHASKWAINTIREFGIFVAEVRDKYSKMTQNKKKKEKDDDEISEDWDVEIEQEEQQAIQRNMFAAFSRPEVANSLLEFQDGLIPPEFRLMDCIKSDKERNQERLYEQEIEMQGL
ncbi:MAG: hypothetical protein EZS28_013608 [Streblomastix strix]|uniref:Uncharacterized protein n=1 Tax=Streblomastix strix TaxID=222440 RepID=A0A5J4W854_9EUKA|nr:MAG: hypothetical protein EZS28_013608 [Streblomastix strix]